MPGTFLSSKERERLACFPEDIPNWDLITYFILTEQDHTFIKPYRSDAHRLAVALQLCAVRYLGFCPTALHGAPIETISHLAGQLQVSPSVLQDYGTRRMTQSTHFQAVLDYLDFRRMQNDDQDPLLAWLTERALEHDKPTLLFQIACEHLKQQKILRPGVTVVERLVVTARTQAHHESLRRAKSSRRKWNGTSWKVSSRPLLRACKRTSTASYGYAMNMPATMNCISSCRVWNFRRKKA
jgi:hypothetical protein